MPGAPTIRESEAAGVDWMLRRLTPRLLGGLLVGVGIAGAVTSLLADAIGLGRNQLMYGRYQFIGTALGFILIVVGMSVILIDRNPQ